MRQFQVGLPLPAPIATISLINQSYLPVKDLRFFARAKKKNNSKIWELLNNIISSLEKNDSLE